MLFIINTNDYLRYILLITTHNLIDQPLSPPHIPLLKVGKRDQVTCRKWQSQFNLGGWCLYLTVYKKQNKFSEVKLKVTMMGLNSVWRKSELENVEEKERKADRVFVERHGIICLLALCKQLEKMRFTETCKGLFLCLV